MATYSFNKAGFRSDKEIEKQYENKIELFVGKRDANTLPDRDQKILKLLNQGKIFDPRYKDIFFPEEDQVDKAIKIAENLDLMSDNEFLISSYPYEWIYEIDIKKIGKVVNKEAVKGLKDIVLDNSFWKKML